MPVHTIKHPRNNNKKKGKMNGERMTKLVFTVIVIQTSLAVEMDTFAGPFVRGRDQKTKNERPIIGTFP